ncbi:MAG TPA: hypothetical protein DG761_02055 [Gammaproteobacteria bacterium]|nr:hypothetical protein [Acidiferrobacteraceae bacterium]MDP6552307.1 CNNM domain-containing protein [Arenicellales bacterium]MDP6790406.1 CNNM domain-containing protein [Arenicellales bacterium]MDP6919573.1 CNNM domain-containing protein [Arenicellales bacterium]HCX86790.1 hypothetical protein [Gammaproteobacteria bacterium]
MIEGLSLILLLGLSAFFSGSETALVALSRARADALADDDRPGARSLQLLKANPSRMLVAILIGNNLVNISASALATVLATQAFGSMGPGIAVGVLTIVILVFGEITPKSLATRYSERISLAVAPVILALVHITAPVSRVFEYFTPGLSNSGTGEDPTVTESELISMAGYGEEEGTIEESEKQLIERAFAFSDLTAGDVMTPRHKVFGLAANLPLTAAVEKLVDVPFSRIPLHGKDPDEIVGVVHVRELLSAILNMVSDRHIEDFARAPYFIPEGQSLNDTIAALRHERNQLAIVVDEHGIMEGVVTLEDLMEELVGEIYDESDVTPSEYTVHGPDRITIEGASELRILCEHFGANLSGKPTDSVSRWILAHAQRIPESGEEFELDGLQLTVVRATPRRIQEVLVWRGPVRKNQMSLDYTK